VPILNESAHAFLEGDYRMKFAFEYEGRKSAPGTVRAGLVDFLDR
jgi:hypothetical protein